MSDDTITVKIWAGYEPEGKPFEEFEVPVLDWGRVRPPGWANYVEKTVSE